MPYEKKEDITDSKWIDHNKREVFDPYKDIKNKYDMEKPKLDKPVDAEEDQFGR